MSPIERETKLAIAPRDYADLLRGGEILDRRDQLNIYLLDPGRLREERGYLRVRFESGRNPVATLKIPVGWSGDAREMLELERPLSEFGPQLCPRPRRWVTLADGAPEDFMNHLRSQGMTRLRRLGWMRNLRSDLRLAPGTVEVDRTVLPNGEVHHEVEVEHPVLAKHRELTAAVQALAPSAAVTREGKLSRFLAALPFP